MGSRMRDLLMGALGDLRYEPTNKRVRAVLGDRTVVDSTRAVLVWEPRRVVPAYAVPVEDVAGEVDESVHSPEGIHPPSPSPAQPAARAPLDPRVPFGVHSALGLPVTIRAGERTAEGFLLSDVDLAGYVVLDFRGFDAWYEEDDQIRSHPHDPFHRIDVRRSSRHIIIELDGHPVADTTNALLLFETMLPTRYYLPRSDVLIELHPSTTRTTCAYKGAAVYWSADIAGRAADDLAWSIPEPLNEANEVAGLICFFDERLDLSIDGQRRPRPTTPWS
jgi:uncharacterized protein (DUF427 family)